MKGVERLFTILKRDGLVATIVAMPVVLKRRIAYQNMFKKNHQSNDLVQYMKKSFGVWVSLEVVKALKLNTLND